MSVYPNFTVIPAPMSGARTGFSDSLESYIHQRPARKAVNGIRAHDGSKATFSTGNPSWACSRDLNGLLVYESAIVQGLFVVWGRLNPNSLL